MSEPAINYEDMEAGERVRRAAITLAALAQNGRTYARDPFDLHRYGEVAQLAQQLIAEVDRSQSLNVAMPLESGTGYATPKVDVRGAVFDTHNRVLLLRERSDTLWSLPGGWADPFDTPTGAVVREIAEETGYDVTVKRLVACYDRDAQGHLPKMNVAVYKLLFLCELAGKPQVAEDLETLEVDWFAVDALPPLSLSRVHADQIDLALRCKENPFTDVYVD